MAVYGLFQQILLCFYSHKMDPSPANTLAEDDAVRCAVSGKHNEALNTG